MLDLVSDRTMLQETVDRIRPIIPLDQVFVATNESYAPLVREQVPDLPPQNVIEEPSAKGTASCIGLAALHIKNRDPQAVMASLHADHAIPDPEGFRNALMAAGEVARKGQLVTLGIQPTGPSTAYGYIHRGEQVATEQSFPIFRVQRFVEKPPAATASEYVQSGEYYWNSGIFIWQVSTILGDMQLLLPDLHSKLTKIDADLTGPTAHATLLEHWSTIEPTTIDVGIMERADDVAVLPLDVGWNDVGSWSALAEILPRDEEDNVVIRADHLGLDTKNTVVYSSRRLIATIGLEDMIIVDTDDALLVCPQDRAQDVRKLVDRLKEQGKDRYL
jgi:mannose-1-phosphate guanylyltransferase